MLIVEKTFSFVDLDRNFGAGQVSFGERLDNMEGMKKVSIGLCSVFPSPELQLPKCPRTFRI